MTEYAAIVVAFQEWFRDALLTRHQTKLKALEEAEAEVEERFLRAWGTHPSEWHLSLGRGANRTARALSYRLIPSSAR